MRYLYALLSVAAMLAARGSLGTAPEWADALFAVALFVVPWRVIKRAP